MAATSSLQSLLSFSIKITPGNKHKVSPPLTLKLFSFLFQDRAMNS